MKRVLMAAVLAASTLGLAGAAMAADAVGETPTTRTQLAGASDGSFIKQQSLQYSADNGE
jgi:opacity protein-like surface antigen